MKIGTFLNTIFMLLATLLQTVTVIILLTDNRTFTEYNREPLFIIAFAVLSLTYFIFHLTLIPTKKKGMILGSIFIIIGILLQMIGILSGDWVASPLYVVSAFIIPIGAIFHFIGCLQYRKNNVVGLITGFIFFIILIVHNLVICLIVPYMILKSPNIDTVMQFYLSSTLTQSFFYLLHSFVLSFSKKQLYADDGAEDMLSVESGDAFASYVPSSKKKKPAKAKKGKEKEEDFAFDF